MDGMDETVAGQGMRTRVTLWHDADFHCYGVRAVEYHDDPEYDVATWDYFDTLPEATAWIEAKLAFAREGPRKPPGRDCGIRR